MLRSFEPRCPAPVLLTVALEWQQTKQNFVVTEIE